jgi:hypothetical protein
VEELVEGFRVIETERPGEGRVVGEIAGKLVGVFGIETLNEALGPGVKERGSDMAVSEVPFDMDSRCGRVDERSGGFVLESLGGGIGGTLSVLWFL